MSSFLVILTKTDSPKPKSVSITGINSVLNCDPTMADKEGKRVMF